MRYIVSIIILVGLNTIHGQNVMYFSNSTEFSISQRTDTLDLDYGQQTLFPANVALDLECDSQDDIMLNCYQTPIQYFPDANHIEIQNLAGTDFEMISNGAKPIVFRNGDTIDLQSETRWLSRDAFQLFYFNVIGGAAWTGHPIPNSTDSTRATNMYVVFRKKIGSEYAYGWIKYSGNSYPTFLYLQEVVLASQFKVTSSSQVNNNIEIQIYPNPVNDYLRIKLRGINNVPYDWQIYNTSQSLIGSGTIFSGITELDLNDRVINKGLYVIRITNNNNLFGIHKFVKL